MKKKLHILKVRRYVQQDDFSCGYHTALSLIRYFNPQASSFDIYRWAGTTIEGTDEHGIINALKKSGLKARQVFNATYNTYAHSIINGCPVVAYSNKLDHWFLLTGICGRQLLACDSDRGLIWMSDLTDLGGYGIFVKPPTKTKVIEGEFKKSIEAATYNK